MPDYQEHYAIQASLAAEETLLAPVRLFDLDAEALYSSFMELVASPLPSGRQSPFSNKATGSNHSILISALAHQIETLGHEIDKIPDRAWINLFRLLGVEQLTGDFPRLEVEFSRSIESVQNGLDAIVPIGTEVRNSFDPTRRAYTTESLTISGADISGRVIARVDRLGEDLNTPIGTYTQLIQKLPFVDEVRDTGYVSTGADEATLAQAIAKARSGIRTGNLGRYTAQGLVDFEGERFLGRCVTLRDYVHYAERLGAAKATSIQGIAFGASGYYGDLVTVVVYPAAQASSIGSELVKISDASARFDVIGAQIIPIDGIINIKTAQNFSRQTAIDAISAAIVDTINPPFGSWGDRDFSNSISTAIERIVGIYAVPSLFLKNADSGIPLEGLEIKPWHLFEVQDTLQINVV